MASEEIADLYAANEDDHETTFPLCHTLIYMPAIKKKMSNFKAYTKKSMKYTVRQITHFGDAVYNLITRDNRIVIPQVLQCPVGVKWYHELF
jgi:hypothetical protein